MCSSRAKRRSCRGTPSRDIEIAGGKIRAGDDHAEADRHRAVPAQGMAEGQPHHPRAQCRLLEAGPALPRPGRRCASFPDGAARAIAVENGEVDLAPMTACRRRRSSASVSCPSMVTSQDGNEGLGPNMWLEVNLREKPLPDLGSARPSASRSTAEDRRRDLVRAGQARARADRQRQPDSSTRRCKPTNTTRPRPTSCSTRPAISAAPTACASS